MVEILIEITGTYRTVPASTCKKEGLFYSSTCRLFQMTTRKGMAVVTVVVKRPAKPLSFSFSVQWCHRRQVTRTVWVFLRVIIIFIILYGILRCCVKVAITVEFTKGVSIRVKSDTMERLWQLARRRDNSGGKKNSIDKKRTNDDTEAGGESSIEVNRIVRLHHLSDAAMKQAASKESGGDDELDNSSQTSLGLEDLVDQNTGPQAPTDKNTRRNDSFVRLGHASDISVAISLATEYSGRRERNSLQLSSKPWKAVTEQPHQRRQRTERTSLNRSMSVSSLEARRQNLRKECGTQKSLSSLHTDIHSDNTRSTSCRRRRRVIGRSSSSIVSNSSAAGAQSISSSRGSSGRRRRQTSSTSLNSTSSSRSPHKEGNDILSPKVKRDEVRRRRQHGRVDRTSLLKRSTSSPAVLRQNGGKQETDLDGVRSSPRKKYSRTSNVDFPATKKKENDSSSNRVSQRSRVTPSPSKQTRRLGDSFSSLTYSSLRASDLDFGGSFSSFAHTSCIGLDEKSKEWEDRRRRYAQNRKINNELLTNSYPIDFGGTVPAIAHASYNSRSKVNQQNQQNDDYEEDDIVSLEDEIEDSFPNEMCIRKEPARGAVSTRANKKHQKRSKHHQRPPDIKKDTPDTMKLHSSGATFTDTTDTTAQESASFSSLSTTFSTTFQAMMQQTEQQQQQQQHEIDDSYYREHSLMRNTRNSRGGGSSGQRARR